MRWRGWWLAAALFAEAAAQEQVLVRTDGDREIVTVRARVVAGANTPGGSGFVRLEASNLDDRGHAVVVEVKSSRWSGGGDTAVRQVFALAAKERAVAFLPLPTPFPYGEVRVDVDGVVEASGIQVKHGAAVHGLLISDRTETVVDGLAMLQALPSGASDPPEQTRVSGAETPTDWRLFTGFHAVVVDGSTILAEAQQEALRRHVFVGGTVLIARPDLLPAGSLRELATGPTDQRRIRHGFGVVVVTEQLGGESTELRRALEPLPKVQDGPWPAPAALAGEQPIPGLGRAPVTLFLVIILVFAAVAGPVNFLWLRRRRRPQLALVSVPVLGFGTTLLIVGFGFLNDGFGIRGVVTSWTVLDQGRRELAVVAARTLFAGFAPGSSTMGADVLLLAPRVTSASDQRPDRWHYDQGTQRLNGVLPSRVPTPLLSMQQAVARQRLRAQVQADGQMLIAAEGGLEPLGSMVLRDFDGNYWLGKAPSLQKVDEQVAERELEALRRDGRTIVARPEAEDHDHGYGRRGRYYANEEARPEPQSIGALAARALAGTELPHGSYLLRTAAAPWLDEHGLRVSYDEQRHFVFGRLQAEDLVR